MSVAVTPLAFVLGKGGVGKTTVARGLAALDARRGRSSVVLEPGLGAALGEDARQGIETWRLDELAALRDAVAHMFGSPRLAQAVLGQFAIKRIVTVVPGLREMALLLAAVTRAETGQPVIVDMPATGHGLAWIATVELLRSLSPIGRARALIEGLAARLADPQFTRLVVVTLCEPLVVQETRELCAALPRPPVLVVVNQVHQPAPLDLAHLAVVARGPVLAAEAAVLEAWAVPTPVPRFDAPTAHLVRRAHVPVPAETADELAVSGDA